MNNRHNGIIFTSIPPNQKSLWGLSKKKKKSLRAKFKFVPQPSWHFNSYPKLCWQLTHSCLVPLSLSKELETQKFSMRVNKASSLFSSLYSSVPSSLRYIFTINAWIKWTWRNPKFHGTMSTLMWANMQMYFSEFIAFAAMLEHLELESSHIISIVLQAQMVRHLLIPITHD